MAVAYQMRGQFRLTYWQHLFFMIGVSFWTLTTNCLATTHALLIGVSGYPSLPETRRLRGPANDVQIMRNALIAVGTPSTSITILADGVTESAALPTRQNIITYLRATGRRSKPEDWLILYFSAPLAYLH